MTKSWCSCSSNHSFFNKGFCCEYCNPCTICNNIALLCESMFFYLMPFHIWFLCKRFLTDNTRISAGWCKSIFFVVHFWMLMQDLLGWKRFVTQVAQVFIWFHWFCATFFVSDQVSLQIRSVVTRTTKKWAFAALLPAFSCTLFTCTLKLLFDVE